MTKLQELRRTLTAPDIRAVRRFRFPSGDGTMPLPPPTGDGPRPPAPLVGRSADAPYGRQILPPWAEKLGPISTDFSVQDFELLLPAGAGATVVSPSFQVPQANVGWLQQFQLYVLAQNAGTSVTWQLRMNGGPVAGFSAKRNPPGVANLVLIDLNDLQVRIPQGALVDVLITNQNANGPWTVGTGFAGWHHALQAELDRWGPV